VGINQVSVLSLEMFRDIDRCLNSGTRNPDNFNGLTGINLKGIYNNGFAMVPL
jgi:hypothetical protein